ncbi:hypothetical protein [Gorillibacterium sp. sgz500922]|uniref:hypothetical protein n=1 Tax=Gorillibacterium sp. sgz500922 TaxID=3446694 RepID=UPI003F66C0E4
MSFKSIDMQIAVHKHHEAGRVQSQLSEKPVLDQMAAAASQLKQDAVERQRSPQATKAEGGTIRNPDSRKKRKGEAKSAPGGSVPAAEPELNESPHPYKGHRLDITL